MDMACMDSSSHHHHHHQHQEMMASQSLDNILVCTKPQNQGQQQEKKPRPTEEAPKCPRCDSTNTKFCYYNNYSLSQPRYFCKSCRRYWTKGGTLRNVPVGGGCRKNRRSSSLSRRTSPDHDQPHHHVITSIPTSSISTSPSPSPSSSSLASPNSILFSPFDHQYHTLSTNDLTLGMARLHKQVDGSMGFDHHENHGNISLLGNPSGNSHFDLFGNSFLIGQPTNGLHQLYYRLGGNNVNVSTNEDNNQQNQMGMQFDQHSNDQEMMSNPSSSSSTPSTIKQEVGENKVLWGFPWKLTSGEDNNMNGSGGDNELDSIKETWNNGVIGSSWFNLLNSPII